MQFARSAGGDFSNYAIKFFFTLEDFHREAQLYQDSAVRRTLPALKEANGNEDARMVSRSGFVFPSYVVRFGWHRPCCVVCVCEVPRPIEPAVEKVLPALQRNVLLHARVYRTGDALSAGA